MLGWDIFSYILKTKNGLQIITRAVIFGLVFSFSDLLSKGKIF
jgi:hypothetical protein